MQTQPTYHAHQGPPRSSTIGELPSHPDDVESYLEKAPDAERAVELLEGDRNTPEWWALLMGSLASVRLDELHKGASPTAVLHAARMQAAHSMLVFKQSLEEHVWTGYKHTRLIYEIASASARAPEDSEKIQALRPLFLALEEDVLHAWVEGDVEIGPRIGWQVLTRPYSRD